MPLKYARMRFPMPTNGCTSAIPRKTGAYEGLRKTAPSLNCHRTSAIPVSTSEDSAFIVIPADSQPLISISDRAAAMFRIKPFVIPPPANVLNIAATPTICVRNQKSAGPTYHEKNFRITSPVASLTEVEAPRIKTDAVADKRAPGQEAFQHRHGGRTDGPSKSCSFRQKPQGNHFKGNKSVYCRAGEAWQQFYSKCAAETKANPPAAQPPAPAPVVAAPPPPPASPVVAAFLEEAGDPQTGAFPDHRGVAAYSHLQDWRR